MGAAGFGPARRGVVWHVTAWLPEVSEGIGGARQGSTGIGRVGLPVARQGKDGCGWVWKGLAWRGMATRGMEGRGLDGHGVATNGTV